MIGTEFTHHRSHSLAVVVRVVAAVVVIASLLAIPTTLVGAALQHLSWQTAAIRVLAAVVGSAMTILAARRFDPLRS